VGLLAVSLNTISSPFSPRLVVDLLRQGSFFSYIVVEIVWLSILWVLWLSSGSYTAWADGQITIDFPGESNCDFSIFANSIDTQECHDVKAIMAFSFLIWILLMSYTILLLVLAIRAQERGNSSWTTGVRDGVLFYSSGKSMGGAAQVQASAPTIPYSQPSYSPAPPQQALPQQALPQQPLLQQPLSQQTLPQQQSYPSYPSPYPTAQV
jgi:hypothetical protein